MEGREGRRGDMDFVGYHLELTAAAAGEVFAFYEAVVPYWRGGDDFYEVC